MAQPDGFITLSAGDLAAQRLAHARMRREGSVLAILLLAALVAVAGPWGVVERLLELPVLWFLTVFFGALVGLLLLISWRQWALLVGAQLTCPHCHARLAERVRVFPSPSPFCPACGERAMAPVAQLRAGVLSPLPPQAPRTAVRGEDAG